MAKGVPLPVTSIAPAPPACYTPHVGWILFLLFVALPIGEIWLLLAIGRHIGFWPTLGFVIAIGAVGAALARAEGTRVFRELQRARQEGRVPEEGLISGLLVMIAGILFVLPGFITDVIAIILVFPLTRRLIVRAVRVWMEKKISEGSMRITTFDQRSGGDDEARDRDVIDAEILDEKRHDDTPPK